MSVTRRRISAEYEGEEIGVGDSMLVKAMAESYGKSEKAVKESKSLRFAYCNFHTYTHLMAIQW